jgi:hypothetical protein
MRHQHSFTEQAPRPIAVDDWMPWPISIHRCKCGEVGYPVPAALADKVAVRDVSEYLDEQREGEA